MRVHFIAIGGAVMHNLALALQAEGHQVTGSDDAIHEPSLSRLREAGLLPPALGWHPQHITPDLDAVILGMHARADNPELLEAQALDLTVQSYPEFVYSMCQHKQRIVIAGSHGKTTVTGMVMHVLHHLGRDFDYLVGAQLQGFSRTVRLSATAPVAVFEGDEYLASPLDRRPKFLVYQPHVVVLTGIAWDHMNVFPTEALYEESFRSLLRALPKAGTIIYNAEDPRVTELVSVLTDDGVHYRIPYEPPPNRVRDHQVEVKLEQARGRLEIYGRHNLSNLAAAYQVCRQLAISAEAFLAAMASFQGADMRLQKMHEDDRMIVIRDFAHSPSKVKATVAAVASRYRDCKLIAVLELHTFSSLNPEFLPQYHGTLKRADHRIVLVNAHALAQKKMTDLTNEAILHAFGLRRMRVVRTRQDLALAIKSALRAKLPPRRLLQKALAESPKEQARRVMQRTKTDTPEGKKSVVLLMSSGSLDGLQPRELAHDLTATR